MRTAGPSNWNVSLPLSCSVRHAVSLLAADAPFGRANQEVLFVVPSSWQRTKTLRFRILSAPARLVTKPDDES